MWTLKGVYILDVFGHSKLRGGLSSLNGHEVSIKEGSTISGKVDIDTAEKLELNSVTLEEDVSLYKVESVHIFSNTHMRKKLYMQDVGDVKVQGQGSTVLIDGRIIDIEGRGFFLSEEVRYSSSLSVTDRVGDFVIAQFPGQRASEVFGEIVVVKGSGLVSLTGLSSYLQKFTCKEHRGMAQLRDITGSNSVFFDRCESVSLMDVVVNDKLSVLRAGYSGTSKGSIWSAWQAAMWLRFDTVVRGWMLKTFCLATCSIWKITGSWLHYLTTSSILSSAWTIHPSNLRTTSTTKRLVIVDSKLDSRTTNNWFCMRKVQDELFELKKWSRWARTVPL